ncbi:MAG: putative DNA binding domain-containing protein [Actinobacteria bacterium]|nr:putative DNA binding domain-containing protein [Actinomycetota bacterium]
MQALDDQTLNGLLLDLESDRVERKQSFTGSVPTKVREAVCAFANDLAGHQGPGVVFIGAQDDGSPAEGFSVTDELLRSLADIKDDGNIMPPPTMLVEKRPLGTSELAAITVWPCGTPPVRFQGRIHVRWGPRRGFATAQDERILNERRRFRDRPFDVQPVPSAKLDDLDQLRFEQEYLPSLVARDVLVANDRNLEQRLAAAKLIVEEHNSVPTVLGLLVCGKSPSDWLGGAYTQFLRIAGSDLTSPAQDEEVIHGTVADQIRRLEEKLEAHNRRRVDFVSLDTESIVEDYDFDALRQLVRNAYLHRSYEATNSPVRVYWFDDRLEIHNPGGPFGSVTVENFGQPGVTDYRNRTSRRLCVRWVLCSASVPASLSPVNTLAHACASIYNLVLWLQSSPGRRHDQYCFLQQQRRRRKDFVGLSYRLDVRRTRISRAGGGSGSTVQPVHHGVG